MVKSKKDNPPVCSWTESRILPTATLGSSPSLMWFRIANRRSKLTNNLLPTLKRPAVKTRQLLAAGFQIFLTKKYIPYWYTKHSHEYSLEDNGNTNSASASLKCRVPSFHRLVFWIKKATRNSCQSISSLANTEKQHCPEISLTMISGVALQNSTFTQRRPTPVNQGKVFLTRTFMCFHS